ncbi:hypothetical protein RCJ22_11405 [Vibrio sp. FNV 38]|nr:hypothetical protein [Vibrio sp. FNV 38]
MKPLIWFVLPMISTSVAAEQTPSPGRALVLPGFHEQGSSMDDTLLTKQEVILWEQDNSDVVFGSYKTKEENLRVKAVGYMYNQKLEMNSSWLENDLRNYADQHNIDFENFFLHFSEDTILAEVDQSHGEQTLLNRKPMVVGYTADENHAGFWLYQQPPWNADVFENHHNGGALYIYHAEQFDLLTLNFSQFSKGGSFTIEYPSAIDQRGQVSSWSVISVKKDKTEGMTRDYTATWDIPTDWARATTHDGTGASYGGGQYFGSEFIRDGGRLYVVRIRWHSDDNELRPLLNEVKLKNVFPTVKLADAPQTTPEGETIQRWRKIRGFDSSADLNNDNYLSWNEFKNRNNKKATARFRWESRVIPFGKMWNQRSSWAITNLANPEYLQAMQAYYHQDWEQHGLAGAYNDDTNKLIGANQFSIYSGGQITELGTKVGSDEAERYYQELFSSFLQSLSSSISDALVSVNIGTANLYGRNGQSHLRQAASLYLREHYVFPSTGLSGYSGLAKFWDNSALAHQSKSVIFQATTRYGRVQFFGQSELNWQKDQYSALAAYYLNHHDSFSYFNQWNSSYQYGSNNTTNDNFFKPGIPKNIAYQPTHLQTIDIGKPANTIPDHYQPIPMMLSTVTHTPADYTIIGDSSMFELVHQDLPNGITYVAPTYSYFLYQSEQFVVPGGPQDMVLAREFSNGRVLYRTDFFGKNVDFYSTPEITIALDKPMRPVLPDGQIGDYTNEISLGGYEGLILLH